jgi:hypothetical protein
MPAQRKAWATVADLGRVCFEGEGGGRAIQLSCAKPSATAAAYRAMGEYSCV